MCVVPADGLEGSPAGAGEAEADCTFDLVHTGSLEDVDLYAMITVESFSCKDAKGLDDDSEFCDIGADLTAVEFDLNELSLGAQTFDYP